MDRPEVITPDAHPGERCVRRCPRHALPLHVSLVPATRDRLWCDSGGHWVGPGADPPYWEVYDRRADELVALSSAHQVALIGSLADTDLRPILRDAMARGRATEYSTDQPTRRYGLAQVTARA